MLQKMGLILIVILLSACGTRYPSPISQIVNSEASVRDVQQGLAADKGVTVRWGGVIAKVNNQQQQTWLEVVQLPLRGYGKPKSSDVSSGRFLVKIEGFLDPDIYAKGREFTAVGILSGLSEGKVGDFDYKFPVVTAQGYYLWPKTKDKGYYNSYFIPVSYWQPYSPYYYPHGYYSRGYSPRSVHPKPSQKPSPQPRK